MASNVEELNRIVWYHQGQFDAVSATYPTSTPAESDATSNTNGFPVAKRYIGGNVYVKAIIARAGGAADAAINGWGYSSVYFSNASPPVSTAWTSPEGWVSVGALENGALIAVATDAVQSVNVVNSAGNTVVVVYNAPLGALFERMLFKPVAGTFDTVDIFIGLQLGG